MVPRLATLLCLLGIVYLFKQDRGTGEGVSRAVWIPGLWIFFSSSRFASQWLYLGSTGDIYTEEAYSEGSPLDRLVFSLLILAGVWILRNRKLDWQSIIKRNAWIWIFFAYAALSIFWSDDFFISFKRWIKGFGNLIMALVIMTEQRPYEALFLTLRRIGYILVPLSVLFIRFYPELGRAYHMGSPMFTGVCFQKNSLGQLLIVLGTYFCWELLIRRWKPETIVKPVQNSVFLIMLPMILWLLYMAHSASAIAAMFFTTGFLIYCRLPMMVNKPERILSYGLTIVTIVGLVDYLFDLKDKIIRLLGREPDLTDRTPVWGMVIRMVDNPLIGTGYESFWSGNRLIEIWRHMGYESGGIIQAHNGYIEIYLNMGIIGLVLLSGSIISGLLKAQKDLKIHYGCAVLRMCLIFIVVINNYTEATYKPVSYYFVLLLVSILEINQEKSIISKILSEKTLVRKAKSRYKRVNKAANTQAATLETTAIK